MDFSNPSDERDSTRFCRIPTTVAVVGCSDNPERDSLQNRDSCSSERLSCDSGESATRAADALRRQS